MTTSLTMESEWIEKRFTSNIEGARTFVDTMASAGLCGCFPNALDIGCGTGALLRELVERKFIAAGVGIDFSSASVAAAAEVHREAGLSFEVADIRCPPADLGQFAIVLSDSVFQMIESSDTDLADKLGEVTAPNGLLCFSMPVDSLANRLKIGIRKLLKVFRTDAMDRLILAAAKTIYSEWSIQHLRDRVPYLYLTPIRLYGPQFKAALMTQNFVLERDVSFPSTSFLKLGHRFLVFRKVSNGK